MRDKTPELSPGFDLYRVSSTSWSFFSHAAKSMFFT